MSLSLRLATVDDIPAALQLCRLSGWNQRTDDWTRLIEYESDGCFAAEMDGEVVGTVTTTRYGTRLAWIGMMLVHPGYRRRGIATSLMSRSLDYLRQRRVGCIKLDATPEGQHVYEQLGFVVEYSIRRWMRIGSAHEGAKSAATPASPADCSVLDPYCDLDRQAFGVDRREWLARLLPASQTRCRPTAMGMLRPGFLASYLGPFVASSLADARMVLEDLVACTAEPIFWDIPDPNQEAVDLARALQFQPVRLLTRMWTGAEFVKSDLRTLFALADPSTG